jgi:hypothetical protein
LYFAGGAPGGGGGGRGGGQTGAEAAKLTPVNTGAYDELLGRTYADIGNDAHSNHKCQGVGGLGGGFGGGRGGGGGPAGAAAGRGAPAGADGPPAAARGGGFPGGGRGYTLVDTTISGQLQKEEASLLDGVDTSLTGIAQYAGPNPPRALTIGLAAILTDARTAQKAFAEGSDSGTAAPVEAGLAAVRASAVWRSASRLAMRWISVCGSRSAIIRMPCWPPMMSRSTHWRTTGWWWPGSRCNCC